jgi:hypothetical protein
MWSAIAQIRILACSPRDRSSHQSTKYVTRTNDIGAVAHVQRLPGILLQLIGDENTDVAPSEMPHQCLNVIDRLWLQVGERLVEQQVGRPRRYRAGDLYSSALDA